MKAIKILDYTGDFAENKDSARKIRIDFIDPLIERGENITLNFNGITSATQSFIHALISQTIRKYGVGSLELIHFKDCNDRVKTIIEIVIEYVQDGIFMDKV